MNTARVALLTALFCSSHALHARYFYRPHTPAQTWHNGAPSTGKVSIHTFNSSYVRSAHRAFGDGHGLSTKHLSSLYFGKDQFRGTQMFKNCLMPQNTQHYNPYIRVLNMTPRVQYTELGHTIGFTAFTTSASKKVRYGVRASMPLIKREVERKDKGSRGTAPTQNVRSEQLIPGDTRVKLYRMDFLEALNKNDAYESIVTYNDGDVDIADTLQLEDQIGGVKGAIIHLPEGRVPRGEYLYTSDTTGDNKTSLPANFENLKEKTFYEVIDTTNYTTMAETADKVVAQRLADQDLKATVWLAPTVDNIDSDTPNVSDDYTNATDAVENAIRDFNANQHEWFYDQGFEFASAQEVGLGDVKLEAFASYEWTPTMLVDLCAGLSVPSATGSTNPKRPYDTHLGMRKHPVLFAGAGFDKQLANMRHRLSGNVSYHCVLPSDETRCAMPIGAQVKNLGVPTPARTSWNEVHGSLWLHLVHPHESALETSIGYKFYHKSKDRIAFAHDTLTSWLGNTFNSTIGAQTFSVANTFAPNVDVSAMQSTAFAHTIAVNASYRLSNWMKLSTGGSYVIAGKNTPQVLEAQVNCSVAF